MFSLWILPFRPEECYDMTEGVRACSHTEEAPDTEERPPFEGAVIITLLSTSMPHEV